jgi:hypothetical protein
MSVFPLYSLQTFAARLRSRLGFVGGLLLVAMVGAGTSENASASCGDWLAHPPAGEVTATVDSGATTASQDSDSVADFIDDQRAPKPCNGPNCRGGSKTPMPPVPPPASQNSKIFGCRPETADGIRDNKTTIIRAPLSDAAMSGHASRIDRPPRSV